MMSWYCWVCPQVVVLVFCSNGKTRLNALVEMPANFDRSLHAMSFALDHDHYYLDVR